ncbi:Beta-barrel assembly machine subunit BamD [Balneicella halophila]|uniref:Beta-barrel assembly machine subunit BamD n=1 Tax=Balneicella halophila TaxID=1537566 RepID=A0A7L4URY3_BALHA|nr:outer membrane protein assembly factor BamD [Balneicella halophila]PVX52536.1 Beta-barrel assembly machine subunit BamD [Balneicella halophila]
MRKIVVILIGVAFFFASCGEYQEIKKSTNAEFKLKKAIEYFNSQDYAKTLDLLDDVRPLYRGRTQAPTIEYYYAYSLYEQKRYLDAGNYFNQIVRLYPKSPYVEECLYMKAFCYYKGTPMVLLDQTPTKDAIQAFETYIKRYPNSSRNDDAKEYISKLYDKLVKKSYLNAKSYYDREYYDSAIIALNNSIKEYPESGYREEILFMLLESRYQLAKNSIPSKKRDRYNKAKEEYLSFAEEFPDSKYVSKAKRMNNNINEYLGTE